MKIRKSELVRLANEIREKSPNATPIQWAINYHLPLLLWGVENASQFINAMLIAATQESGVSICGILGLDRCIEIGSPLLEISKAWASEGKIETELEADVSLNTGESEI